MPDKIAFHNVIDGQSRDAADGRLLDIIDPVSGTVYATSPNSGEADVDTALKSAAKGVREMARRHSRRTPARPAAHRRRDGVPHG